MAFQNHYNHLYQFSVIEDGHRATEKEKQARLKRQQQRQVVQENLALRELRRQQQLWQQQQNQQPQIVVDPIQREETPPPEDMEAVMPPQRPQKDPGQHRVLMNFEAASKSKWPRSRSCNRIAFIQEFDNTNNPFKVEDGDQVNQDDIQEITIANAKTRAKAKSLSTLEPTTLTKEDAEFIASTVLDILDKKETYNFVKDKLLQDKHISHFTKEEISISVQDVSFSTDDNNASTSSQGSSFHSIPSSQTSPVNLNLNSGEAKFSPVKKVTPTKNLKPKLPLLRQKRQQLKDRFARYDEAATITIQQLINPPIPQSPSLVSPSAAVSPIPAQSPSLVPTVSPIPVTLPRVPCSVCDNSRFFLFSPESRKKLSCSCDNRIVNNFASTVLQSQTPEVPQLPSQLQREEKEVTPTPTRRETRQRGVPRGIWDRKTQMFKPFK